MHVRLAFSAAQDLYRCAVKPCSVPNAGSFIRPSASVSYGVSFLEALTAKYIDLPHGSPIEKVILGSSNGTIQVEAVGLDKIRSNLSRLEGLREVSLDGERISRSDPAEDIEKTCSGKRLFLSSASPLHPLDCDQVMGNHALRRHCSRQRVRIIILILCVVLIVANVVITPVSGVRGLDLSKNLFPSWDVIAQLVSGLPHLRNLALKYDWSCPPASAIALSFTPIFTSQNRLSMPKHIDRFQAAFSAITELQLNATLITWPNLRRLMIHMPGLMTLEAGYNRIHRLETDEPAPSSGILSLTSLRVLNLDANELSSWADAVRALQSLPRRVIAADTRHGYLEFDNATLTVYSLQRVILSSNRIATIDSMRTAAPLPALKQLSLASNALKDWKDIDRLYEWCPSVTTLTLSGNPLTEGITCPFSIMSPDASFMILLSYIQSRRPRTREECKAVHNCKDPNAYNTGRSGGTSSTFILKLIATPVSVTDLLCLYAYALGRCTTVVGEADHDEGAN